MKYTPLKIESFKNINLLTEYVADLITTSVLNNRNIVLGLPTGKTYINIYKSVVVKSIKNNVDWSNVTTFNLDEFYPIDYNNNDSFHYFMRTLLFNHINIKPENVFFPILKDNVINYNNLLTENKIKVMFLGLGENGHIGYNEPGTNINSISRIVILTPETIKSINIDKSINKAITIGLKQIMASEKIILVAFGENKRNIINKLRTLKEYDKNIPASCLLFHSNVEFIIDE